MKVTIDAAGRLVLPKAFREAIGIAGGAAVEVTLRDGRIEIEVPPAEVRLEKHGDVVVAVPAHDVPPLRTDAVRATQDAVRAER
ncbi:MAG: AbrB/MazE/SpoVT family DNA-binding domain-containing protein [Trueperaceae bacterium]|nr:AbrB/MazE/SpoVT family DNA-binding domain-containing protein [Trueperaceae bacterium]